MEFRSNLCAIVINQIFCLIRIFLSLDDHFGFSALILAYIFKRKAKQSKNYIKSLHSIQWIMCMRKINANAAACCLLLAACCLQYSTYFALMPMKVGVTVA